MYIERRKLTQDDLNELARDRVLVRWAKLNLKADTVKAQCRSQRLRAPQRGRDRVLQNG